LLIEVRRKSDPILVLFFVSGFSGLIYEIGLVRTT
jgi:hypothetical protein